MPERDILEILRCPACVAGKPDAPPDTGKLRLEGEGALVCITCGHSYSITNGIPDMTLEGDAPVHR